MPSPTILVIDDDEANRLVLSHLLTKKGVRVVAMEDGASGLVAAAEHLPDCIVLDVFMPGEDGFSILKKLKSDPTLADIPVVMFTIVKTEAIKQRALAAGAEAVTTKPFDMREIVDTILQHTRRPPQSSSDPTDAPARD